MTTAATAVCAASELGPCFFRLLLVALRFEFRELLRSQNALDILHELGFARFCTPGFVVVGHRRVQLRFLICCQVETRKRGHTGHVCFIPSLFRAIAVFTREHGSRCKRACCH
jgi:hypothetical protein